MSDSEIKERERQMANNRRCNNASSVGSGSDHRDEEQQQQSTNTTTTNSCLATTTAVMTEEAQASLSETEMTNSNTVAPPMPTAMPADMVVPPGVFAVESSSGLSSVSGSNFCATTVGSSGTTTSKTVMEIAPNLFVPYRGSQETWQALQTGNFTVTTCFVCALPLVVMDTAEYMVCPDCHSVSPLSYKSNTNSTTTTNTLAEGKSPRCGVGLGIKREWCEGAIQYHQQHPGGAAAGPIKDNTKEGVYKKQQQGSAEQHRSLMMSSASSPEHHNSDHLVSRRATFLL